MNNVFAQLFPILLMIIIFYFLLIRPQQKQMKERQRMLDNLKVGDKVLTVGGIIGTIADIKGNEIEIEIAKNVRVKAVKSAVSNLV
ncbi:MAG: preprotein translocase subunit YajC [Elusimicrobiales bacterium]